MFSVIIPAYNAQDFIERTVYGVLDQEFTDFELIVVDDGSTDGTAELVENIGDSRLVLVRQENKGEGGARNTGIRSARYPWIAFLDADDYWFSDHLSELARLIGSFPDAGMVASSFVSGSASRPVPPRRRSRSIERVDYFKAAARQIGVVWSSTVAIRRDVVRQTGWFGNHRRGADQEYWVRAALVTPVARSRRVTAYYYRHAASVMATDHDRTEITPSGIVEMWPSVAAIRSVEGDARYENIRPSLIAYERHATYLSMIGYISRRRFDVARRLARNIPGSRFDRAGLIAALLKMPDWVISLLLKTKRLRRGTS